MVRKKRKNDTATALESTISLQAGQKIAELEGICESQERIMGELKDKLEQV